MAGSLFFLAVFYAMALPPLHAAIPNSEDLDAYTEKDFCRELYAYNIKTMSGAYSQHGHRDPRWDDLAVELLDAQAALFTNSGTHNTNTVAVKADQDRMNELANQLSNLGCDDPLVIYVAMRQMMPRDKGYVQAARRAYKAMADSQYPLIRKHAAAVWLYKQIKDQDDEAETTEVLDYIKDNVNEQIEVGPLSAKEQRFLYRIMVSAFEDLPRPVWKSIVEKSNESDSPNRWLIDMIDGSYHLKAAWDDRGSGWASTVTDEGWDGFRNHLEQAKISLDRAWLSQPDLPNPASKMITVSMGLGDGQEQLWFTRAISAQFDFYPAYDNYGTSLRPRWGGSHAQLHAFATECLETQRFDTEVPRFFYEAMRSIQQDTWDYRYWAKPGVYEQFVKYFEGRKHEPNPSDPEAWWDSMTAVMAWRVGRYQEAADQIQAMGESFNPRPFTYFQGTQELGLSELSARLGPHGDYIKEAEQHWYNREYNEAAHLLDAALKDAPDDDPARPYLEQQSARAAWMHGTTTGEWINLLDRTNLGGWEQDRGVWTVDNQGRITGRSTGDGIYLKCRHSFGYHIEIRGTLTLALDDQPTWYNGGVLLAYRWSGGYVYPRAMLLFPDLNKVAYMRYFYYDKAFYPVDLDKTNTFHIQMWDEHLRMYVNDQLVIGHRVMPRDLPSRVYPFALGSGMVAQGVELRFDKLEVRILHEKPTWTDTEQTEFTTTGDSD
jgi:hypothetical protein